MGRRSRQDTYIFHNGTIPLLVVQNEINGLNNIGMLERGTDAELAGQFLHVFFFSFIFSSFSEFLDSVKFVGTILSIHLVYKSNDCGGSASNAGSLITCSIFFEEAGGIGTFD